MNPIDGAALFFDTGLLILIWLVQVVIYPSFREIAGESFLDWHATYSRRISYLVIPLMFGQLGVSIAAWNRHHGIFETLGLIAIGGAWLATFLLAVPLHRRLGEHGKDDQAIERLIRTNWVRSALWTTAWALTGWRIALGAEG